MAITLMDPKSWRANLASSVHKIKFHEIKLENILQRKKLGCEKRNEEP